MSRSPYIVSRAPGRMTVRPDPRVLWRVAIQSGVAIGAAVAAAMAVFTVPDLVDELRSAPGDATARLAVYCGFGALVAIALAVSRGVARMSWCVDAHQRAIVVALGRRDDDEGVDVSFDRVHALVTAPRGVGRYVPELELVDGHRLALGPPVRQRTVVDGVVSEACALLALEVDECG